MPISSVQLILLLAVLLSFAATAAPAKAPETVTINLTQDLGPVTYRASGFLHGITATTPGPDLVESLRPQLFRNRADGPKGGFATYERDRKMGARSQIVMSDSYGYPSLSDTPGATWPGDGGDWTRWDGVVDDLLKRARDKGYTFEWDIWNEPDDEGGFWQRGRDRFFETWTRTFRRIRQFDPHAVIVGPSIADYSGEYLKAFLRYAKEHQVLPDVLTWHELLTDKGSHKQIPAHVAEMRRFVSENRLPIARIDLNEIIGRDWQLSPGLTAWFLAHMEASRVDGACHATWPEPGWDTGEKGDRLLSGTLTYQDQKPRSAWWVYQAYADITGRLVAVVPSETVGGVAGLDREKGEVRVILGREALTQSSIAMRLTGLSSLTQKGTVHVTAARIPCREWDALPAPLRTIDTDYPVRDGQVEVVLPEFGPMDAYILRVTRSDRPD